jgi:hypothetical protein
MAQLPRRHFPAAATSPIPPQILQDPSLGPDPQLRLSLLLLLLLLLLGGQRNPMLLHTLLLHVAAAVVWVGR